MPDQLIAAKTQREYVRLVMQDQIVHKLEILHIYSIKNMLYYEKACGTIRNKDKLSM